MKSWLWNGDEFSPRDTIPLTDRGFRYGMAFFETILLKNGAPIFLSEHLAKLMGACSQRDFHFDHSAFEQIENILREIKSDGVARIYVTAGDGTVTSAADNCRVFV